jgi:hypothetical protein
MSFYESYFRFLSSLNFLLQMEITINADTIKLKEAGSCGVKAPLIE